MRTTVESVTRTRSETQGKDPGVSITSSRSLSTPRLGVSVRDRRASRVTVEEGFCPEEEGTATDFSRWNRKTKKSNPETMNSVYWVHFFLIVAELHFFPTTGTTSFTRNSRNHSV